MDRLDRIERLKDSLRATDYIVLKEIEGQDVSEHKGYKEQRQALRAEINALQAMSDEEYEQQSKEEA